MKKIDILMQMCKRAREVTDATYRSRSSQLDDLRFYAGDSDNMFQWDAAVVASRMGAGTNGALAKPCLTINKLPQHVRMVTNDQRQNRVGIKCIPVNAEADVRTAEMFNGIIRHIENVSHADTVYDTACETQVACGEGYWRILTQYCDEDSFQQEIYLERVRNPFTVYLDPYCKSPVGKDARYGFVTTVVSKDLFKQQYPDYDEMLLSARSNDECVGSLPDGVGDNTNNFWAPSETDIRVVEYFYKIFTTKTLHLYPAGETAISGTDEDFMLQLEYGEPIKKRKTDLVEVRWIKSDGKIILEEGKWAGKYIPLVRVLGNEYEVDGDLYISGIVRNAKDPSRLYNAWSSQEAELLALSAKAPYLGYVGQFDGLEDVWAQANTKNFAYLEVNAKLDPDDPNSPILPLPQRIAPPMVQSGLIQAKAGASEDIKSTTGQYNASLGQTSNERSGKAILARERQSDTGTYHYIDNLSKAMRYTGEQLLDLIPKIYDTEQVIRIIGEDGEPKMVKLDPAMEKAYAETEHHEKQEVEAIYNPNVGKYDVQITTGPSYTTKRQESLDALYQLVQTNPNLWSVFGDVLVRNMDWPGAQELAKRLAKQIPPELLEEGTDSAVVQAYKKQVEELQGQLQQTTQLLQNVDKSFEQQDMLRKDFEAQIKAYQAETDRLSKLESGLTPDTIKDLIVHTVSDMRETDEMKSLLEQRQRNDLEQGTGGEAMMGQPQVDPAQVGQPTEEPQEQKMPIPEGLIQ